MEKIWIVMVEQHYAGHTSVLAVTDSPEKAEEIAAESKLGSDVHIYESKLNETYPTV